MLYKKGEATNDKLRAPTGNISQVIASSAIEDK